MLKGMLCYVNGSLASLTSYYRSVQTGPSLNCLLVNGARQLLGVGGWVGACIIIIMVLCPRHPRPPCT